MQPNRWQKIKLAPVREEVEMHSPEIEELTEPDTPPSSQNRPKLVRRTLPTAVDIDVQTYRTVVSGPPTSNVGLVEQGQGLGAPSGTPLPTSFGPLVLPKGPEFVATPSAKSWLGYGASCLHCRHASCRPAGDHHRTLVHTTLACRHGYSAGPS